MFKKKYYYPLSLAIYCVLLFMSRLLFSYSLELDEAEQVLLSQKFQWGYDQQPPLFTWIQIGLEKILGLNLFSVISLRYILIFAVFYLTYKIGKNHFKQKYLAITASITLLFFVQFSIETLRQTHTIMITFAVLFLLWRISKLIEKQSIYNYAFLGLAIAIGLLSKYNFIINILAFFLAGLLSKTYRKYLLTPKILLSFSIAMLIFLPHGLWLLNHINDTANETFNDLGADKVHPWFITFSLGIYEFFRVILSFSFLFIGIILILIKGKAKRFMRLGTNEFVRFIGNSISIALLILLIIALLSSATKIQERWLQPILILLPIYVFGKLDIDFEFIETRLLIYSRYLRLGFGFVLLYTLLRIVGGPSVGKHERINRPYSKFVNFLKNEKGIDNSNIDVVICNTVDLAGNIKYLVKDSGVEFIKQDCSNAYGLKMKENPKKALLIWADDRNTNLIKCIENRDKKTAKILEEKTLEFKFHYSLKATYKFTYMIVELNN